MNIFKGVKVYTSTRRAPGITVGIPCQERNCLSEATAMADLKIMDQTWRFWSCDLHVQNLEDLMSELELSQ